MATLTERMGDIGKRAKLRIQAPKGLTVMVEVLDFKVSYGQDRWLVKPVSGEGTCWVEELDILE